MLSPVYHMQNPYAVAHHPSLPADTKRALLASWASDKVAVPGAPAFRRPPGVPHAIPIDDILSALKSLDESDTTLRDRH